MDSWLSHLLTGIGAWLAGSLFPFVTDWRRQRSIDRQMADLKTRDDVQASQIAALHAEHRECLNQNTALQVRVAILETKVTPNGQS